MQFFIYHIKKLKKNKYHSSINFPIVYIFKMTSNKMNKSFVDCLKASQNLVGCQMAPAKLVGCQIAPTNPVDCQMAPTKPSGWNTVTSKKTDKKVTTQGKAPIKAYSQTKAQIQTKASSVNKKPPSVNKKPPTPTDFLTIIASKIYSNKNGQMCLPFVVGTRICKLNEIYENPIYKSQIMEVCKGCSIFFSKDTNPNDSIISFVYKNSASEQADKCKAREALIRSVSLFHKLNEDIKCETNQKIRKREFVNFDIELVTKNLLAFVNLCNIKSITFVSVVTSFVLNEDTAGIKCTGPDYQVDAAISLIESEYIALCAVLIKPDSLIVPKKAVEEDNIAYPKVEFTPDEIARIVASNIIEVEYDIDDDGNIIPDSEMIVNDDTSNEDSDDFDLWDNSKVPIESKIERKIRLSKKNSQGSVDKDMLDLSESQYYGIITKCCGLGRHQIKVISKNHADIEKIFMGKESNGIINKRKKKGKNKIDGKKTRGSKIRLTVGDIVIFSERGFNDAKVDILSLVNRSLVKPLIDNDFIVTNYDSGVGLVEEYTDDCGFDFCDECDIEAI
jgi:hypothetical protein